MNFNYITLQQQRVRKTWYNKLYYQKGNVVPGKVQSDRGPFDGRLFCPQLNQVQVGQNSSMPMPIHSIPYRAFWIRQVPWKRDWFHLLTSGFLLWQILYCLLLKTGLQRLENVVSQPAKKEGEWVRVVCVIISCESLFLETHRESPEKIFSG